MNQIDREYLLQRTEAELERAQKATCIEAAHVHAELAERYRTLLADADAAALPRLSLAEEQSLDLASGDRFGAHAWRTAPIPLLRN